MTAKYVRVREVCLQLEIDDQTLSAWVDEGLVDLRPAPMADEPLVSAEDADRMRLIALLMREMDVNLAGVEVILHMREEFLAMQRQFDEVLHALVGELRDRIKR
jgi:MerR family transcriptional regulator/heat shock protein HspR